MEDKYSKLAEKYGLPEYSELNRYFSIEGIGEDDNILKEILKKVHSKIDSYVTVVESLIQPDSSLSSMHEASNLDGKYKNNLKHLFARLMKLERNLLIETLEFEEEQTAKVIKESVEQWKGLIPELKSLLKDMKNCWNKESVVKEERGYFG